MKRYKTLIPQVILIGFYIGILVLTRKFFPTSQELVSQVSSFYGSFGYEIIFLASAIEALFIVNLFAPGAVAVGLGAVFARSGQLDLTVGIILAVAGAMLGYILDYLIGFLGFSRLVEGLGFARYTDQAKSQLQASSFKSFSLGFIHPNIGAVVSVAAGILKMNFVRFILLSSLSTLTWYSLWGILGFALGEIFLTLLTKYAFIIMLLIASIWILTYLYGRWTKKA